MSFSYDGLQIGTLAVRALICEVDATPKPGLVDRDNNGAHSDMDHLMFLRSAMALKDCFVQCAQLGLQTHETGLELSALAADLRRVGLAGEAVMFASTGGVNTHKGLVFSLGVICAACGTLFVGGDGTYPRVEASALQKRCSEIAAALLGGPESSDPAYAGAHPGAEQTHGQIVRNTTGISGVKGEALSGFATAFEEGLPRLRQAMDEGAEQNTALVETLIHLLARTDDSNLVYRGGLEGLEFVRTRAQGLLERDAEDCGSGFCEPFIRTDEGMEEIRRFDRECIERNLSPGGCADLLAITIMLHFIVF